MRKKYLIRFNTQRTSEQDAWRVIDGEIEHLVSQIKILVPSQTSTNEMEKVGLKYHISCEGELLLENGIALIK